MYNIFRVAKETSNNKNSKFTRLKKYYVKRIRYIQLKIYVLKLKS